MYWKVDEKNIIFSANDCPNDMWEIVSGRLEEMYVQNNAELGENGTILVSHEAISFLSQEDRDILLLPRIFPHKITVKSIGAVATKTFRYQIYYTDVSGKSFVNPVVIGAYIKIDQDLEYTFNHGQYYISNQAKECNLKSKALSLSELRFYNLKNLAAIKEAAFEINAEMDANTARTKVIIPKKLGIAPKFEANGDLSIEPILLDRDGKISKDFRQRFNARAFVNNLYSGLEGYYVIEDDVFEGLSEIKQHKKIKADEVQNFLDNPEAVFSAEVFDFAQNEYSDRVVELGDYRYRNEANSNKVVSWLPEEGVSYNPLENKNNSVEDSGIVNEENVAQIKNLINEAQRNNETVITYENKEYPISISLLADVNRYLHVNATNKKNHKKERKSEEQILLIKDNFEDLSYAKEVSQRQEEVFCSEYIETSLKKEISLYPHQIKGLRWLLADCYAGRYGGALLSDDMGLGKTIQTLCFLAICKKQLKEVVSGACLIVAPVSLLKNWKDECEHFIRKDIFDTIEIIDKNSIHKYKKAGITDFSCISQDTLVLINYETLRANQLALGKIDWGVMVLDEAQTIKNPFARVSLAVKAMKYKFGLALTGTPIENTWVDLWSIMDFVAPGYHLGTLAEFKKKYVNELKRCDKDEDQIIHLGQKLNEELQPLFLRRLKTELVTSGQLTGLPQKHIYKLEENMPEEQLVAYKSVLSSFSKEKATKGSILQAIFRLRDISLLPNIASIDERAIDGNNIIQIINSSARLKVVFRKLTSIQQAGEKALIFLESKKMQRMLRRMISLQYGISVEIPINGDMDGFKRKKIVDSFNAYNGFNVLILSPIAAGVGLNISSANHVFHLSRHWNPAKEDQATDRAYRIGQKKDVEVYIPIAKHPDFGVDGAFDQKLDQLLDYKRRLSAGALFPVGDSEQDGIELFGSLGGIKQAANFSGDYEMPYIDLQFIDQSNGRMFERIVAELYKKMLYKTTKTPDSNDGGVDVVALSEVNDNLLIQCKKTSKICQAMNQNGIKEVYSAAPQYEKDYGCKFKKIVITNAAKFTSGAVNRAQCNDVKLICRDELKCMLDKYKIEKFLY